MRSRTAEAVLLHPATLASLAVLLLNDRVLRWSYPSALTGKLSDVAGLVFLPLLVVGLLELVRRRRTARTELLLVAAVGVGFAALKVVPTVTEAYRIGMGAAQYPLYAVTSLLGGQGWPELRRVAVVADATDLLALVALVVPVLVLRSRRIGARPAPAIEPAQSSTKTKLPLQVP